MKKLLPLILVCAVMVGCNKKAEKSTSTGWNYNDREWGGFIKAATEDQSIGPNLVAIEGGVFTMGLVDEDVMYDYNNLPKKVTVNSFFMDETEVSNLHYREYVYWVNQVMGEEYPMVAEMVRPDTLVWREELAYNEPYVENYFSFPAYNEYPVVGVSWEQANDFSVWRSDRVNEGILRRRGLITHDNEQTAGSNFNTEAYLLGKYEVADGDNPLESLTEEGGTRKVRKMDGIVLPEYRLPSEAEWEYAALGLIGNLIEGTDINAERRLYPWEGTSMRSQKGRDKGKMLANFRRGNGDLMGAAGALNDNAAITANVYAYLPNDFGLFNMAGNVNEWVADVYRPLSPLDTDDFNPYRGNVYKRKDKTADGDVQVDSLGRIIERVETKEELENRRNYREGDARGYQDGDALSRATYGYGITTLISDEARVFKGGSWGDGAYFLSPGSRRFMQQDQASSTIGFRCAMDMLGGPVGNVIRGKGSRKQMKQVKRNRKAREKSNGKGQKKGLFGGGKKKKNKKNKSSGGESTENTTF